VSYNNAPAAPATPACVDWLYEPIKKLWVVENNHLLFYQHRPEQE